MIYYHIKSVSALMKVFGVSKGYAYVLLEKLKKRESNKLSLNELRLIKIFENNKRNK